MSSRLPINNLDALLVEDDIHAAIRAPDALVAEADGEFLELRFIHRPVAVAVARNEVCGILGGGVAVPSVQSPILLSYRLNSLGISEIENPVRLELKYGNDSLGPSSVAVRYVQTWGAE